MQEALKALKESKIFCEMDAGTLNEYILPHGQIKKVRKDSFIIEPQKEIDFLAVIISGKVQITHIFDNGVYSLTDVLSYADIIGTDLIYTRSKRAPYHAMCSEDTEMFSIPCSLITQQGHIPEQARGQCIDNLLQLISDSNMKKEYRLAILSQKGIRERIVTYLTMQASKRKTDTFTIPFSREELASFLCVNRSALSHELSLMKQEGLIDFKKNVFTSYLFEKR